MSDAAPEQNVGQVGRSRAWRAVRWTAIGAGALFVGIQLVPYGWSQPNPPITQDAPWPDAESERIARSSCYACHSNETDWPAYAYVAPMSWLVRRDVEEGRDALNFSTWDQEAGEVDDAIEVITEGSMPPDRYTMVHRDATLTDAEVDRLTAALATMDEGDESGDEDRRGGEDDVDEDRGDDDGEDTGDGDM